MDVNLDIAAVDQGRGGRGARLAQRATIQLVMETFDLLSRVIDSDTVGGFIFLGNASANTRHLRPGSPDAQAYADTGTVVPDSMRRGISVHALSHEVNLPYETTRRHVQKLIQEGLCLRRADGIMCRPRRCRARACCRSSTATWPTSTGSSTNWSAAAFLRPGGPTSQNADRIALPGRPLLLARRRPR